MSGHRSDDLQTPKQSMDDTNDARSRRIEDLANIRNDAPSRQLRPEALQTQVEQLQSLVQTLESQLAVRDQQIARLEDIIRQRDEGIEWLRAEVRLREGQLEQVFQSRAWRVMDWFWHVRRSAVAIAQAVPGGPRTVALEVGRRLLPRELKSRIKRVWDPTQVISAQELDLLGTTAITADAISPSSFSPPSLDSVEPLPWPKKYDVICFSIIDWDFRWQRPQQLMSQFADAGHRVFVLKTTEFLPPRGPRYAVRPLRENVWEITLASPGNIDVYGGEISREMLEYVLEDLRALRRQFNITCAVSVVQVATWAQAALGARQAHGWRVVYDCMDEWNTFPGMRLALLRQERQLVKDADLLVVSAQRLWNKWADHNPNTVLARNATDFEHFHNPPSNDLLDDVTGPIVGYFGAIAEWFDLKLMLRLARERPHYTFVLLGGVFNVLIGELTALPNVRVLGQKPYALMPAYLQKFDACIIPFVVNAITEATDPVKFYEYVSQGKPVVAPQMPELHPYADYLYIADSHDDFLHKLDLAVHEDDPALRERRVALARENTWRHRFDQIQLGIERAHPKASIVIVTYGNLNLTRLCLDSIQRNTRYPSYEVIVVDNAAGDGTPAYLAERAADDPRLRFILNDRNLGFAAANNQGLAAASGDYLVLLNPDTVVSDGWLSGLIRHLAQPDIGLVGAVTNFSGNESRINVTYNDLDGMEAFASAYTRDHDGQCFNIRVAAMYCVAMRRDVFQQVGPLDTLFTIGLFEDDDYSHRVRLAGYRVVCAEDVFVHHFGQASFKKLSPTALQAIWDRNQKLYEQKWGMAWQPHQSR